MRKNSLKMALFAAIMGIGLHGMVATAKETQVLNGNGVQAQFDEATGTVSLYGYREDGTRFQMSRPSQISYPIVNGTAVDDFTDFDCRIEEAVQGTAGAGGRMTVTSRSAGTGLMRICEIESVDDVEGLFYVKTGYEAGDTAAAVEKFVDCEFALSSPEQIVWSYNGGGEGKQSYYDTLQKIDLTDNQTFYRANKQDETSVGVPAADIYSADGGIAVGDASATRRSLQTPVAEKDGTVYASIQRPAETIEPQERVAAGEGFVQVHRSDYYMGLRGYAEGMKKLGFETLPEEEIPQSSYDLRWESWGWEFNWTLELILGKLDELEQLGIKQVTLDDGWYVNAGEWNLNPKKLPNGDADMKLLTDAIHEKGMTALLWWRPCDGGREDSALYKEHPEYFVKNQNGTVGKLAGPGAFNTFNGTTGYALCPSSEEAVQSQVDFVKKALNEWGFDGLKSDYVWSIPKCYNEAHHHERPEESTEQQAVFYREVYQAMRECKEEAFHLLCNCGTPQDYYSLPYVTQIPTADPTSVDQTRRRVKAYKALAGDYFPVTTDHNEIWYPSTIGTGAVLIEKRNMTGNQQAEYEKWLKIAQEVELEKGTFVGDLYSYGFDPYETYVVNKDGVMYYAFYRDGIYRPNGNPQVELKGLKPNRMYRIVDYVNNQVVATNVLGSKAAFDVNFSEYLLLRAEELPAMDVVLKEKVTTAEETDSAVTFEGNWKSEDNANASGGTCSYTQAAGASVTFSFEGDGIAWYGQKDVNFGTAQIYIDDELKDEVSCNGAAALGVKLYEKTGLADGAHTIKIVCKTPVIDIDRFVYTKQETDGENSGSVASVSQCTAQYQVDSFIGGNDWKDFASANSRLEELAADENTPQSELEQAKKEVLDAALALRKVVDKELLAKTVQYPKEVETTETDVVTLYHVMVYAENLSMENVIPAVRTRFKGALSNAQEVFADPTDQNEINRAWASLLDAIQFAGYIAGDKTELQKTWNECKKIDLSAYTDTQAFETLLGEAKQLLADENALEPQVQQMLSKLLIEKEKYTQDGNADQAAKPAQVQGIAVVSQRNGLQVSWQKQADAASYTVFIQTDGEWQVSSITADNALTISNLKAATKYQIKIAAANKAGVGQESDITYTATKPAKPKIKKVKNYKATGIQIACKKKGETGFEVWVKKGKKAFKKAASGSKKVTVKKGIRGGGKVSVKIRGYIKNNGTTVYGAFRKVKVK